MPFLAMKMDSSLPNIEYTTARITKNGTFTQTIWRILWNIAVRTRIFDSSVSFVSTICQGITNTMKLKLANAIIAALNALGIPKSYSLSSNTIYIISIPSNRSTAMEKHSLETISLPFLLSCESSRSPVFSNSSSRSGVMHRITFNTFGHKNSVLLILSPTILNTIAMFTTKAKIFRPQIRKSQARYRDLKRRNDLKRRTRIQAKTAGLKEKAMKYQLDLPSYFAR